MCRRVFCIIVFRQCDLVFAVDIHNNYYYGNDKWVLTAIPDTVVEIVEKSLKNSVILCLFISLQGPLAVAGQSYIELHIVVMEVDMLN